MSKEENRPPDCQHCKEPCTIHLTQIINGEVIKMDMCPDCPHAKKLQDPSQFGIMEQLLGKTALEETQMDTVCPTCGFTEADFRKHNRFGCPDCYEAFKPLVQRLVGQLHKGEQHHGKVPENLERQILRKRLAILEREMTEAILKENFERAAELRDEIFALRKDIESPAEGEPAGDTPPPAPESEA